MCSSCQCTGLREHPWLQGWQKTKFGHLLLIKSKKRKTSGGEKERNLFQLGQHQEDSRLTSQRLSPKCQDHFQVYIRKMCAKGGGCVQIGREGQRDHCLGANQGWGFADPGQSLLLERSSFCSHQGRFCPKGLTPERRDKLKRKIQLESFRSKWRQAKSCFNPSPLTSDPEFLYPSQSLFKKMWPCNHIQLKLHSYSGARVTIEVSTSASNFSIISIWLIVQNSARYFNICIQ